MIFQSLTFFCGGLFTNNYTFNSNRIPDIYRSLYSLGLRCGAVKQIQNSKFLIFLSRNLSEKTFSRFFVKKVKTLTKTQMEPTKWKLRCCIHDEAKQQFLSKNYHSICQGDIFGQNFPSSGCRRRLLQDDDHSGSRPHSFPGLYKMRSGTSPEWFWICPELAGS